MDIHLGDIYGDLLIIGKEASQNAHCVWKCLCLECGKINYVRADNLQRLGSDFSGCSCVNKETFIN